MLRLTFGGGGFYVFAVDVFGSFFGIFIIQRFAGFSYALWIKLAKAVIPVRVARGIMAAVCPLRSRAVAIFRLMSMPIFWWRKYRL